MTAFAIVLCLSACAGQARRVLPEAAFNPSIAGPRAARAMKPARAKPMGQNYQEDKEHDRYAVGGGECFGRYPPIEPGKEKNIQDTLLDLDGPALYVKDLMTQLNKFEGYDSLDLFWAKLEEFGLDEMLKDDAAGPFTLYAPVNSAVEIFEAMGGEWTKELLMYHIAKGKHNHKLETIVEEYDPSELRPRTGPADFVPTEKVYETVLGQPITQKYPDMGIGMEIGGVDMPGKGPAAGMEDAAFPYNVECTNGYIQAIASVLTLPSM